MNTEMLTNMMGAMGRGGDDLVGHLTHGDVVIPREIILQNPEFLTKFKKAMQDNNQDYRGHIAGSGYENKNPVTGASEFFLSGLTNFFSNPGKQISQVFTNPVGTLHNSLRTGLSILPGVQNALNNYVVDPLFGVSSAPFTTTPTSNLGAVEQPFAPKRGAEPTKPFDLFNRSVGGQQFSTLDPTQQRSYLATQGAQGSGLGDEDKNYYLGLLKRNLIDESGTMQNMNSALLPVERNYLSRLGLPTDNTTSFFQALQS